MKNPLHNHFRFLFWAWLLLATQARSQTFTIWNETGQNIWSIGMWSQANGFMAGDWGLPSINNGAGPITIQSSNFANIYCTPVCSANVTCVSYVNGQGPWPSQTWGGGPGMQYYIVFVQQNTTPSVPEVPYTPPPTTYTNSGCITLNNSTSNPQYYQFVSSGGSGTSNFSGCSGGLSVNGNQGSSAYGDGNEWLAVYPGSRSKSAAPLATA